MTLFTFGYEGIDIETFIARLKAKNVEAVLDIRELPLSRKKGFSKTALGELLRQAGISYTHLPALGCPKFVRDQYKINKNWVEYTRGFESHLATQSEAVGEVGKFAQHVTACLICFEADFNFCHRSIVAKEVAKQFVDINVAHIMAKTVVLEPRLQAAA